MGGFGTGGYGVYGFQGGQPSPVPSSQSAPAVFTYRALGPNSDPVWSSFLSNSAAVAQAIQTRILLFLGEWWESILDGTPVFQQMLGVAPNAGGQLQQQVSLILQQRILASPYVTGITDLQITFNQPARAFGFYAQVQTAFGTVTVSNVPQPPAQGIPS